MRFLIELFISYVKFTNGLKYGLTVTLYLKVLTVMDLIVMWIFHFNNLRCDIELP